MNQAQKDKWIADLRSGQYRQGLGALCRDTTDGPCHCGLGVLVDGANVPYRRSKGKMIDARVYEFGEWGESMMSLPDGFMGLCAHQIAKIGCLNDQDGWDFERIADFVETYVPAA